jgi:hypothetical protein
MKMVRGMVGTHCVPNVYLMCWQEGASSSPKRKASALGEGDQVHDVL